MNLIKHQLSDVDKIYFLIKDSFESKYELLINERSKVAVKHEKNSNISIDCLKTIDDV